MPSLTPRILQELRGLGVDFFKELIGVYLKESGEKVPKLRSSLEGCDASTLEKTAHTLKGSSGNLGAETLSRICADLQLAARAQEWERCADLVGKAEQEYKTVVVDLNGERDKG